MSKYSRIVRLFTSFLKEEKLYDRVRQILIGYHRYGNNPYLILDELFHKLKINAYECYAILAYTTTFPNWYNLEEGSTFWHSVCLKWEVYCYEHFDELGVVCSLLGLKEEISEDIEHFKGLNQIDDDIKKIIEKYNNLC